VVCFIITSSKFLYFLYVIIWLSVCEISVHLWLIGLNHSFDIVGF
jgi:hypothetical protein